MSKPKILWIVNVPLPEASKLMGKKPVPYGGWLVTASNKISNYVDLHIAFPSNTALNKQCLPNSTIHYYSFSPLKNAKYKYISELELYKIINEINPDLVHIFGTELPHSLISAKICQCLQIKFVVSIQGLVSIISHHVSADLPLRVIYGHTFRNLILRDSVAGLKSIYYKYGKNEVELLSISKNVIGRTTWDKACIKQINPNTKYYHCNETLRPIFYEKKWTYEQCQPHTIFFSQAQVPLKGLHNLLRAMPIIKKEFPRVKLYIAGKNIIQNDSVKSKLLMTYYSKYIKHLIQKYDLSNNVYFTGELDEREICSRMLKSNVFVSASSIENSPNSLAEAMILGLPSIASYVGGVPDMLQHNKDGYLYQSTAYYMLAYYVCRIFNDELSSNYVSQNARNKALQTHNAIANTKRLLDIYTQII